MMILETDSGNTCPFTKKPRSISGSGLSKNRSYLLSHLVGQYHRRW